MSSMPTATRMFAALIICATPAVADTFEGESRVSAVTLYPQSAQIERHATLTLPAGTHTIEFNDLRQGVSIDSVETHVSGAVLGPVSTRLEPVSDSDLYAGASEARDRVRSLEAQLRDAELEVARHRHEAQAAADTLEFLSRLKSGNTATIEDYAATVQLIREQSFEAREVMAAAEVRALQGEEALAQLRDDLRDAQGALARLAGDRADRWVMSLEVDVAQEGEVAVTFRYTTPNASWVPTYKAFVNTEAETLSVQRDMQAYQTTGEPWVDVALTFATDNPLRRSEPQQVWPQIRRVFDPEEMMPMAPKAASRMESVAGDAMMEMSVASDAVPTLSIQGLSQTYVYPDPATLYSVEGSSNFALAPIEFDPDLVVRAVPLYESTGFLLANLVNDSGEMLIPGKVQLFRDGTLVGETGIGTIADGEEMALSFGAIDGIKVDRVVLDRNEGDRGMIRRATEATSAVRLSVENLTARTWPIEVIDRVSVSEQEDLSVDWNANPAPDTVGVEDKRGVLAWTFDLAAGASWTNELEETLRWPEGQILQ
ncbi:mucoidy inhibitor MuiA family protein [Celeribacter arenosi]|uniref:DUF4139 domain-containing protein n=1 Tax=Celeribacter arenosi TaxID=792649 RepID=A0ABP7K0H0_9RHOB